MSRSPTIAAGIAIAVLTFASTASAHANQAQPPLIEHPVAILAFRERGDEVHGMGAQTADLLFAHLVTRPSLLLVERDELAKSLAELELNLSGIVQPSKAAQVGQLTGAKIIVTGSVLQVDNVLHVVAKVMGTETSRVLGASVKGRATDGVAPLVVQLADKVAALLETRASTLIGRHVSREDRLAALDAAMGDTKRPIVSISIDERHVGARTIDPAAETELTLYCKGANFTVTDSDATTKAPGIIQITGEGISEFAARHGNLLSVRARLEVKAIDRDSGEVLAIDRQTSVAVDLSEQVAGKQALQQAAAAIAERMLPKLGVPTP